jgi:hypothetical protein
LSRLYGGEITLADNDQNATKSGMFVSLKLPLVYIYEQNIILS